MHVEVRRHWGAVEGGLRRLRWRRDCITNWPGMVSYQLVPPTLLALADEVIE
jgi:hypothetical protein